ncbi:hypothetical protein DPMN_166228 [Dreissena polymorpha]|uniref:Uncharacterized protein n=1 Tax=Dreissena polymorpha TaxID=45954 RepID=A0A9D4EZ30_DREPO|nr:hypothetical protein DPMN_166228 [Dreissena polymorpha]
MYFIELYYILIIVSPCLNCHKRRRDGEREIEREGGKEEGEGGGGEMEKRGSERERDERARRYSEREHIRGLSLSRSR